MHEKLWAVKKQLFFLIVLLCGLFLIALIISARMTITDDLSTLEGRAIAEVEEQGGNIYIIYTPTPPVKDGSSKRGKYTVKDGDTLWDIAKDNGVKVKDILEVNPDITNPGQIRKGQEIAVPGFNP
ncbi:MAG: LysM domain-containing protein [Chloroflexota bacterium]